MLIPLAVLSLGAIFAGWLFSEAFLDSAEFWDGSIYYNEGLIHAMHGTPLWVKLTATIVMLIGLLIAWFAYIRDTSIPGKFVEQFRLLHAFLFNKWYFDELYDRIFVRPAFWFGRKFWKIGDEGGIDRFGPDGAAWLVSRGSVGARKFQSGYLYSYALIMLLGVVAAITWVLM